MNKQILMLLSGLCLTVNSFAQTTRDKIEQQAKDPRTAENAAKADVYIQRNRIYDEDTLSKKATQPTNTIKKKKAKKKFKKKS